MLLEKICFWCKQTYMPCSKHHGKIQKYCSSRCQGKAASQAKKGIHFSPATEWKPGRTPICPVKKGEHISRATEFKKGHSWSDVIKKKMLKNIRIAAEKKRNPDKTIILICPTCHKPFSDFKSNKRRFCSRRCFEVFPKSENFRRKSSEAHKGQRMGPANNNWRGGPVLINCETCGKEKYFIRSEVENGRGRFCSNKCKGVWNGKILRGKSRTPDQVKNALRRRTPSGLELKFQGIVRKHNLPYKYVGNGAFFIENLNPDFINTNQEKIAVEVYARFHKEELQGSEAAWKRKRSRVFAKYGWRIIYFEAKDVNEERVLSKLK